MHIAADGPVRTSAGSHSQQGFDPANATAGRKHTSSPRQLRVLIVEDESCIAMQLEDMVQNLGHEVVGSAASHAQAITSAQVSRPDLALMDINLDRGGDGIEAALELRRRLNVPSVFVSAYVSLPNIRERTQVAQPLGFVPKPYTQREIEAALKQAADQLP